MTTVTVQPTVQTVTVTDGTVVVVSQPVVTVVEVSSSPAAVVNPTLIFKTIDQNVTVSATYTDDDDLRFNVVEGHRYVFRMLAFAITDNGDQEAYARWSVPAGVTMWWRMLDLNSGATNSNRLTDESDDQAFVADGDDNSAQIWGRIDASGGSGEIVFQFRNDDDQVPGSTTMEAGSMIELFDLGVIP